MNIQPIVEGHGDVAAAPVLLRRLVSEAQAQGIGVNRPIRQKQSQLLKPDSLKQAVRLARLQQGCAAILILFEAEDDCPKTLGPTLLTWARAEAGILPCAVALAHREYEAWFLASIESLRGRRGIRPDAAPFPNPEAIRDAKGALEERMSPGQYYTETADQPALSQLFSLHEAYAHSRSFRHLIKAFGDLIAALGTTPAQWPPATWRAEEA